MTKTARAHGALWIVSYFLYLPSTVAFVVYYILSVAFPGIVSYRWLLDIAIPVAIVLGLVTWRVGLFSFTAAIAGVQVVIVGVLAGVEIVQRGAPATAFALHVPAGSAAQSVGLSRFSSCAGASRSTSAPRCGERPR